jgi:two-component system, OmpR family, phosphate regulon sensor histidine kinase PhoR
VSGSFTILVVDDEQGIREGCRRILVSEGYAVDVAENGSVGLGLAKVKPYDLILLDLMMPVMGGLEMMDRVREFDEDVIMIVITGFATIETAVEAIKHGGYDYIPKPFTPDQLVAVVNRGIEKRRLSLQAKRLMEERDQKLLEVATEESKLRTIVNSMADGIVVINRERQLVLWNPAALEMLNLNEQIEPGKNIGDALPQKALVDIIGKAFAPETSRYTTITEEIEVATPEPRTLMVNVSVIRDEGGQELGVVSTLRDITSLKEINQIKSQFVSMVTHELRAPLAAVEGYLHAYLTGAAGTDPQFNRQMLERAKQRCHSLLDLVNDLLTFSRLESKAVVRKKEILNVGDILVATVELLKNQGEVKDLEFQLLVPGDLPLIEADRSAMEQLFTNLVSNAIKYNRRKGKVIVKAGMSKNFLEITVADTGVGIAEENLPHIFDEFYRVTGPDTRYVTGTGLGLSIVKKIIESHFGRIDVESKLGEGTTFTVRLPMKKYRKD